MFLLGGLVLDRQRRVVDPNPVLSRWTPELEELLLRWGDGLRPPQPEPQVPPYPPPPLL